LVKEGRRCPATRAGTPQARLLIRVDKLQLSAEMSATLSAQLKGLVARDLVADIVRAVMDESGQTPQHFEIEPILIEARQRVERFIRARVQVAGNNGPGCGGLRPPTGALIR
jgi:hypothetical protein